LGSDDGEEGKATGFEETEEETGDEEGRIALGNAHERLSQTPSEDENGHEVARRHPDDQVGAEWLPSELGHGGNGANHGVLCSNETGVLLETEYGSITESRLVGNLEQVNPNKNDQDGFVSLAKNALALFFSSAKTIFVWQSPHVLFSDHYAVFRILLVGAEAVAIDIDTLLLLVLELERALGVLETHVV
jgi:hypothetical protein